MPVSRAEMNQRLLSACADMAWWFGWPLSAIEDLSLDDFEGFQKEVTRQMKAGYVKGV